MIKKRKINEAHDWIWFVVVFKAMKTSKNKK